jgi:predicted permease
MMLLLQAGAYCLHNVTPDAFKQALSGRGQCALELGSILLGSQLAPHSRNKSTH